MIQHKTINRNGYNIIKSELTEKQIIKIKKDLTVKPMYGGQEDEDTESFEVFRETDREFVVPRYYGIETFGKPKLIKVLSKNSQVNFQFNGSLREHQQSVVEHALEKIKLSGGGILALPTGFGKTTIALYLASVLKLKTLVVVHKTFLQNQWMERIKQFTNARIGIIRQKKKDVENKDIVIGMLQSIALIDYDKSIFKDFDLIIYDECHRTGSRIFSKSFFKTGARYTLGLSATPKRADGLAKVFKWFLGDIIVGISKKGDKNIYVNIFKYDSNDPEYTEKKRWIKGGIKPDTVGMTTKLIANEGRNQLIAEMLYSLKNNDERKILVLSDRINHLETLKKLIDSKINNDISENKIYNDEFKTAFYIGKMKHYELKDAEEADIIFGTYQMAQEGLDIAGLNTLVLASPKKDIIQSIGRIMRKPIEEGDVNPLIIDICDDLSVFSSWGNKRESYYKEKKYTITTCFMRNNKIMTTEEYIKTKFKMTNIVDVRKEYITHVYGDDTYEMQCELEFPDFDETKLKYDPSFDSIFDYSPIQYIDPTSDNYIIHKY